MERVLHLARMMAGLHLAEYEGSAIARASWKDAPEPGAESGVRLQRRGSRFLQLRCTETEEPLAGEITVSLMLGKMQQGKARTAKAAIRNEGAPWRSFSKEEILAFVTAAGDENSIHRRARAVVPGLLILRELLAEQPHVQAAELRFFHPLHAGEEVRFVPEKQGFLAMAGGEAKFFCRLHGRENFPEEAHRKKEEAALPFDIEKKRGLNV